MIEKKLETQKESEKMALYLIDLSCPIEILWPDGSHRQIEQLVQDVKKIMKNGLHPVRVDKGTSGVYCFINTEDESVAIVKPADEEPYAPNNPKGIVGRVLGQPGLRDSIRVGESVYREAAVYLLDYGHFANVPHTALVKFCRSAFNVNDEASRDNSRVRIASIQQFIPHDFDASDHGTSSFPVTAVHRIGILDIRTFNTDRHGGNLLVKKHNDNGVKRLEIIPIDHGLCLPENLEDPYFEWLYWSQASIPFMEEELKYIEALDPYRDADMLKNELPMIRKGCRRVLILSTIFLKEAAAYGLTLSNIGEMMTRPRFGEPSKLEQLCMAAVDGVRDSDSYDNFMNQSVLSAHNLDTVENKVAAGSGFVKLEDIKEEVWADFLDKFQTLLYPAFEIL